VNVPGDGYARTRAGPGLGSEAAFYEPEFRTFSEAYGTVSPSKFTNIQLLPGDEVLIDSPGGGGYGDPLERDRDRVLRDVEEGFVSTAAAADRYGWDTAG